jgi:HSP20 family protein
VAAGDRRYARGDTLVVPADLPGLTPDEVKLEVKDGILTVSGEHQEDRSDADRWPLCPP